jgi:hypothetical protein
VGRRVEQDKGGADLQVLGRAGGGRDHTRGREQRRSGPEEDDGGPRCKMQKVQGLYCNAWITFKPVFK